MNAPLFSPPPGQLCHTPATVLSLFPGAGLFEHGFIRCGFCVVRGPDKILHQDVCDFHAPAGVFDILVGGPPCQDFSGLRRTPPTGNGVRMLGEMVRIIGEAEPVCWIVENVPRCPSVVVRGYAVQEFHIDASHFGAGQRRLRLFQIGRREGLPTMMLPRPGQGSGELALAPAAVANDDRSVTDLAALQGFPADFTLPEFTRQAAKRAIGNGVPFQVSLAVADAVRRWLVGGSELARPCACGCARNVTGRAVTASVACRKRLERQRRCDAPDPVKCDAAGVTDQARLVL